MGSFDKTSRDMEYPTKFERSSSPTRKVDRNKSMDDFDLYHDVSSEARTRKRTSRPSYRGTGALEDLMNKSDRSQDKMELPSLKKIFGRSLSAGKLKNMNETSPSGEASVISGTGLSMNSFAVSSDVGDLTQSPGRLRRKTIKRGSMGSSMRSERSDNSAGNRSKQRHNSDTRSSGSSSGLDRPRTPTSHRVRLIRTSKTGTEDSTIRNIQTILGNAANRQNNDDEISNYTAPPPTTSPAMDGKRLQAPMSAGSNVRKSISGSRRGMRMRPSRPQEIPIDDLPMNNKDDSIVFPEIPEHLSDEFELPLPAEKKFSGSKTKKSNTRRVSLGAMEGARKDTERRSTPIDNFKPVPVSASPRRTPRSVASPRLSRKSFGGTNLKGMPTNLPVHDESERSEFTIHSASGHRRKGRRRPSYVGNDDGNEIRPGHRRSSAMKRADSPRGRKFESGGRESPFPTKRRESFSGLTRRGSRGNLDTDNKEDAREGTRRSSKRTTPSDRRGRSSSTHGMRKVKEATHNRRRSSSANYRERTTDQETSKREGSMRRVRMVDRQATRGPTDGDDFSATAVGSHSMYRGRPRSSSPGKFKGRKERMRQTANFGAGTPSQ